MNTRTKLLLLLLALSTVMTGCGKSMRDYIDAIKDPVAETIVPPLVLSESKVIRVSTGVGTVQGTTADALVVVGQASSTSATGTTADATIRLSSQTMQQ